MYKQYALPYAYDALEPHIDALTVETHHAKHHAAYTKNFVDAAEKAGISMDIQQLLSSLDEISDPALRQTIRNQGGGYYSHNLYFSTIGPDGGGEPTGLLLQELEKEFGSFAAFKEKISALATGQFGSGWAWLSANREGKLKLSASPNQDNPLMEGEGFVPILAIDVWEHAYYLKYKNLRADHVKALFNVISWDAVAELYEAVKSGK